MERLGERAGQGAQAAAGLNQLMFGCMFGDWGTYVWGWAARLGLRQLFALSSFPPQMSSDEGIACSAEAKGPSPIDRSIDDRRPTIPRPQTHDHRASLLSIDAAVGGLCPAGAGPLFLENLTDIMLAHHSNTITPHTGSRQAACGQQRHPSTHPAPQPPGRRGPQQQRGGA